MNIIIFAKYGRVCASHMLCFVPIDFLLLFYIFLNTFDVKLVFKVALLPTIAFFTVYVFFQTKIQKEKGR